MKKVLVFILSIVLSFTMVTITPAFTGKEWKDWSAGQRLAYILGFYDAIIFMKYQPGFDEYILETSLWRTDKSFKSILQRL